MNNDSSTAFNAYTAIHIFIGQGIKKFIHSFFVCTIFNDLRGPKGLKVHINIGIK